MPSFCPSMLIPGLLLSLWASCQVQEFLLMFAMGFREAQRQRVRRKGLIIPPPWDSSWLGGLDLLLVQAHGHLPPALTGQCSSWGKTRERAAKQVSAFPLHLLPKVVLSLREEHTLCSLSLALGAPDAAGQQAEQPHLAHGLPEPERNHSAVLGIYELSAPQRGNTRQGWMNGGCSAAPAHPAQSACLPSARFLLSSL